MRTALSLTLAALALVAPGCGKDRQPSPNLLKVVAPSQPQPHEMGRAGMSLAAPGNWTFREGDELPRAFSLSSGSAVISGWAYRREEPLPKGRTELEQARKRLQKSVQRRDPKLGRVKSEVSKVAGHDAITVGAIQVLRGQTFTTRSVHVFAERSEYVIDELVPPRYYPLVDGGVMEPLLRSLKLRGAQKAPPPPAPRPAPVPTAPTTTTPAPTTSTSTGTTTTPKLPTAPQTTPTIPTVPQGTAPVR